MQKHKDFNSYLVEANIDLSNIKQNSYLLYQLFLKEIKQYRGTYKLLTPNELTKYKKTWDAFLKTQTFSTNKVTEKTLRV